MKSSIIAVGIIFTCLVVQAREMSASPSPRQEVLLSGPDCQYVGAAPEATLPEIDSTAFNRQGWKGQETDLSFTVTRPSTVYVMATKEDREPGYLTRAGFEEVAGTSPVWRDNNLLLVPAQLFSRKAAAGDTIHLAHPDRDQIVLIKEGS